MYQPMPPYLEIPVFRMPPAAQMWSLYVYSAIVIATVAWALVRSQKEQSLKPLLYVIGGALTCFLEPVFARLADATHAQVGQITAFESLGLRIPVHVAISYTFYFGLAYVLLVPKSRDRVYDTRQLWLILGAITVSAWVYEVPFILLGLWAYYGDQPYQLFAAQHLQPVWWSAGSAAMLMAPITLLAVLDRQLVGARQWLIVPLAPMAAMAGAAAVCWPVWVTLNSPAGDGLKFVAATLTILFSALLIWLLIPLVARDAAPAHDRPN